MNRLTWGLPLRLLLQTRDMTTGGWFTIAEYEGERISRAQRTRHLLKSQGLPARLIVGKAS
ncbi:hypothetical protein GCM10025773_12310 [Microbacterium jejuense]